MTDPTPAAVGPDDAELDALLYAEGSIRWRLARGWRIERRGESFWWIHPQLTDRMLIPAPALSPSEIEMWEQMRPKETPNG